VTALALTLSRVLSAHDEAGDPECQLASWRGACRTMCRMSRFNEKLNIGLPTRAPAGASAHARDGSGIVPAGPRHSPQFAHGDARLAEKRWEPCNPKGVEGL
jgi:hypothetical protein